MRGLHIAVAGIVMLALISVLPARRSRAQGPHPAVTTYTVTDLGTLGGTQSKAYGINECGWVVGEAQTALTTSHAFVWSGGSMTDIVPGDQSIARSINEAGIATGEKSTGSAFIWSTSSGVVNIAGPPGANASAASDINDSNMVAGTSEINFSNTRGFTWQSTSGPLVIDPFTGGSSSAAFGINNAGQVVGSAQVPSGRYHAYVLTGATMTDLGTLNGLSTTLSLGYAINDSGQVVGYSTLSNSLPQTYHAFIWTPGDAQITDMTPLVGNTLANDINNNSQAVGRWEISPGTYHAFTWTVATGIVDLNDLTQGSGWTLQEATSINDRGQIVGFGISPSDSNPSNPHAFLLTPSDVSLPPAIVSSVSGNGVYGGAGTLTATLSACGSPLAGKNISFKINGASVGTAVTDASGIATLSSVSMTGLNAGSQSVEATFAGDGLNSASSAAGPLTISKTNQTIAFGALSDKTFGDADFGVSATATSNLAVSFGVAGNCTITGSTVHITGTGSCTVTASQGGDGNYNPASNVQQSFNINKGNQIINFGSLSDKTFGDADFGVSATASSGFTVSFAASGNCTVTGSTVHLTGAGSCTITASQSGDTNYNAAMDVARSFNIAKANQTITFNALADKTYGDSDFGVSATASSGLSVSFAASGDCTVTGSTVHLTGAGSCTITASQGGNTNYNAATDVPRTFSTAKANTTTTVTANNATYDVNPHGGTASVTGPAGLNQSLTVTYSGRNATVYGPSTTAPTNAGDYTASASYAGDSNYNSSNDSKDYSIAKASQTITFNALSDKTYGDADFSVSGTASSGLTVSFAAAGNCTASGSTVHITGGGSCTITASQGGDGNYNAAANVDRSFNIAKANQTITFGALSDKTFGDADFGASATASSGLAVSFSASGNCTVNGSTVHITSAGSCTVTASQAGDGNYLAASNVQRSFNIAKANQTITFGALANKTFGDADFVVNATTTSPLPVSFAATSGQCAMANANTVHISGAGSCTITASQAGGSDYNAATSVPQSFNIAKGTAPITLGNLSQSFDGNPKSVTAGTTPPGLNVTIVYTQNGAPITPVNLGSYDVSATINDANYQGSASGTLVIHIPAPVLVLEENSLTQLAAIDSVTFACGPFRILNERNFSADHHTRILFFTSNLGTTDKTQVTVQASGVPLTVEAVGPLSGVLGFAGSYVIVRLEDGLPTGDVQVTITLQGVTSAGGIITIVQ